MNRASVWNLDASRYVRHPLHADSSLWVEKNCYIDVWIEVLHAAGLEPLAALPFTVAIDFDGDQWTFFKPSHSDIASLYGVGVQELNVYRPILEHCLFHVSEGRLIFSEADAYWLPDTRGTDYRTQHTKSTIVVESLDVERRQLGYFHNAGYFSLEGEDFVQLFRLGAAPDPTFMPLFAELVKVDRRKQPSFEDLARESRQLLVSWLGRRPATNPVQRFERQFTLELESLKQQGIGNYHTYAFATIRQCGAGFDLLAEYLRWLGTYADAGYLPIAKHFDDLSSTAKTLILKGARAVNAKKAVDFSEAFAGMATSWDSGMRELVAQSRA